MIGKQVQAVAGSSSAASSSAAPCDDAIERTPRQRFELVYAEYRVLIQSFLESCKGGPLAWPPLSVLQDQLRMEQVDAREKILRDDLRAGNELPCLSAALKDASAVVKLLGEPSVPAWLRERAC